MEHYNNGWLRHSLCIQKIHCFAMQSSISTPCERDLCVRVSYNGWSILKKWQIKSNQDCGEGIPGPRFLSRTLDSKSAVRDLSGSLTTWGWETSSTRVLLIRWLGAYWFQKLFALFRRIHCLESAWTMNAPNSSLQIKCSLTFAYTVPILTITHASFVSGNLHGDWGGIL